MTTRDRRALVLGAAVVLAAVGLRVGTAGVRVGRARLDQARQAEALSSLAQQLVAQAPGRQGVLRQRARDLVDLAPVLLAGSSPSDAAATLAGELHALATRHRVAITRVDPVPDSAAAGGVTRIEVRLHAEGDLGGLYGFIHAVETGKLLLSFTGFVLVAEDGSVPVERLRFEAAIRGWSVGHHVANPEPGGLP